MLVRTHFAALTLPIVRLSWSIPVDQRKVSSDADALDYCSYFEGASDLF